MKQWKLTGGTLAMYLEDETGQDIAEYHVTTYDCIWIEFVNGKETRRFDGRRELEKELKRMASAAHAFIGEL